MPTTLTPSVAVPSHHRRIWLPLLLAAGLGWIPLLWFQPGAMMTAGDVILPASLAEWRQYLSAWNWQLGAGVPFTLDFSALGFRAIGALAEWVSGSMRVSQQAEFVFWFSVTAWSISYLLTVILDREHQTPAVLVGTCFYLFNMYVAVIWLNFEKANISAYAGLPALLACLHQGAGSAWPQRVWWALRFGLLSVIIAAVGSNPPVFVAFSFPLVVYAAGSVIRARPLAAPRAAMGLLGYHALVFGVWLWLNLFWLLPQAALLSQEGPAESLAAVRAGARAWLIGISSYGSFANVVRLLGDWTLYQGWNEPYHTYSHFYRYHPVFWVISWLIPLAACYGWFRTARTVTWRTPLAIAAIASLVLSMGAYPTFGWLYLWLFDRVPYFWAIRSPWNKFALVTCLAYAVFIAVAWQTVTTWLQRVAMGRGWRRPWAIVVGTTAGVLCVNLAYAFPVSAGRMFAGPEERRFLPPNRFVIPSYVTEAGRWFNDQPPGRVYSLPGPVGGPLWYSSWGYHGVWSILNTLIQRSVVFHYPPAYAMVSQLGANPTWPVVAAIDGAFTESEPTQISHLFRLLGVRYVLQENDAVYHFDQGHRSPEWMRRHLAAQRGVRHERSFGPWDLYVVDHPDPPAYSIRRLAWVAGDPSSALGSLSRLAWWQDHGVVFADQLAPAQRLELLRSPLVDTVVLAGVTLLDVAVDLTDDVIPSALPNGPSGISLQIPEGGRHVLWATRTGLWAAAYPGQCEMKNTDGTVFPLAWEESFRDRTLRWQLVGAVDLPPGRYTLSWLGGAPSSVRLRLVREEKLLETWSTIREQLTRATLRRWLAVGQDDQLLIRVVEPPEDYPVTVGEWSRYRPGELGDDGRRWRWIPKDAEAFITLHNTASTPVDTNIACEVYSLAHPRTLLVKLDGHLVAEVRVLPNTHFPLELHGITLPPGPHRLQLESPDWWNTRRGEFVSFAITTPVRVGPLAYWLPVEPVTPDTLRATVYPATAGAAPPPPVVNRGEFLAVAEVIPETTPASRWTLLVSATPETPVALLTPRQAEMVEVRRLTPTRHQITLSQGGPQCLIVNEGYHSGWHLAGEGPSSVFHVPVYGFANGFIGTFPAGSSWSLEYRPQAMWERAGWCSLIGIAVAALLLLGTGLLTWVRAPRTR